MTDIYGFPPGGFPYGPPVIKHWQGLNWQLSWEEMVGTVDLGGWPHDRWAEAAAVAAAESSRDPFVYNTLKLGHFGLFQISRSDWSDFFTGANSAAWVVPPDNAKKAYEIYGKQGWGAWSTHTSGAYLLYLPQAKAAVAAYDKKKAGGWKFSYRTATSEKIIGAVLSINPQPLGDAAGSAIAGGVAAGAAATAGTVVDSGAAVASSVGDMASVFTGAWTAITNPSLWMRFGYGTLGVVLVAGGLFLILRNQPAVQQAAKTVATVAAPEASAAVKGA